MKRNFTSLVDKYLNYLNEVETAFLTNNTGNKKLILFWRGLVRDSDGRWLKYYYDGYKYFLYGKQSKPDFSIKRECDLFRAALDQHRLFVTGLKKLSYRNLRDWLQELHKKQIYTGNDISITGRKWHARIIHSKVVVGSVLPLVEKYADPYVTLGKQRVFLPGIDKRGLPSDIWINKNQVSHFYPDPKYFDKYLTEMEKILDSILTGSQPANKELLGKIALYYQYGINMHMFENINQSLFVNQINALLKIFGFKQISHGILDFAAMRLQPENFRNYFIDEVTGSTQSPGTR